MAAMNLLEAAKLLASQGDVLSAGVAKKYAGSSAILANLPFVNIAGNALQFNREDVMPSASFRALNEAYSDTPGSRENFKESLAITGGDIDVDRYILRTMGMESRTVEQEAKLRAIALNWTRVFIKGDTAAAGQEKEFDGLQKRITGNQLIPAGSTSGGDALSLLLLDQLIDQVDDANALVMNKKMKRLLSAASRNTSVGGYITYEQDAFGKSVMFFNGLPILTIDLDNTGTAILPFTEANPGGGTAASTSIYAVNMSEGNLYGIQNGLLEAEDLGQVQDKPVFRTRVEWYTNFVIKNVRGAARLHGIKDAAVTA